MTKILQLFKLAAVCFIGAMTPLPAGSATFSITSGDFGPSSIPELPQLNELISNQFGAVDVTVPTATEIGVYKLRQTNPVNVGLTNPSLVGSGSFDVSPQSYNAARTYLGAVDFVGDFNNSLGIRGQESGSPVTLYYPVALGSYFGFDVPSNTVSGIPPGVVAISDVLYVTNSDGGVYRLQAVPELPTWVLLLASFAALMFVRHAGSFRTAALR